MIVHVAWDVFCRAGGRERAGNREYCDAFAFGGFDDIDFLGVDRAAARVEFLGFIKLAFGQFVANLDRHRYLLDCFKMEGEECRSFRLMSKFMAPSLLARPQCACLPECGGLAIVLMCRFPLNCLWSFSASTRRRLARISCPARADTQMSVFTFHADHR